MYSNLVIHLDIVVLAFACRKNCVLPFFYHHDGRCAHGADNGAKIQVCNKIQIIKQQFPSKLSFGWGIHILYPCSLILSARCAIFYFHQH